MQSGAKQAYEDIPHLYEQEEGEIVEALGALEHMSSLHQAELKEKND